MPFLARMNLRRRAFASTRHKDVICWQQRKGDTEPPVATNLKCGQRSSFPKQNDNLSTQHSHIKSRLVHGAQGALKYVAGDNRILISCSSEHFETGTRIGRFNVNLFRTIEFAHFPHTRTILLTGPPGRGRPGRRGKRRGCTRAVSFDDRRRRPPGGVGGSLRRLAGGSGGPFRPGPAYRLGGGVAGAAAPPPRGGHRPAATPAPRTHHPAAPAAGCRWGHRARHLDGRADPCAADRGAATSSFLPRPLASPRSLARASGKGCPPFLLAPRRATPARTVRTRQAMPTRTIVSFLCIVVRALSHGQ